jgi:SAM-dependent methyltransferase
MSGMGLWSVARASLREFGLWRTLRAVPRYALKDWWANRRRQRARQELEQEDGFDEQWGTETTALVARGNLDADGPIQQAVLYWPILPRTFAKIMTQTPVDFSQYAFIDLGCGKGRALFLASEFPFTRIIGVEFSPSLVAIAERNTARFQAVAQRGKQIEIRLEDASTFAFPDRPLFLFMFDPFRPPVLTRVLENLRQSLKRRPRPIVLAYVSPHADEQHLLSFLECMHTEAGGLPEENKEYQWALYTNDRSIARRAVAG